MHEGLTLYDRFKLKKHADGDWTFAKYSKLGNLIKVRYGEEWFEDESAEFEESNFEGFEFICRIQPKTDSKGKQLKGSTVDWQSMRQAGGTEERAITEKVAQAEAEEDDDFSDTRSEQRRRGPRSRPLLISPTRKYTLCPAKAPQRIQGLTTRGGPPSDTCVQDSQ